MMVCQAVA